MLLVYLSLNHYHHSLASVAAHLARLHASSFMATDSRVTDYRFLQVRCAIMYGSPTTPLGAKILRSNGIPPTFPIWHIVDLSLGRARRKLGSSFNSATQATHINLRAVHIYEMPVSACFPSTTQSPGLAHAAFDLGHVTVNFSLNFLENITP